MCAHFHHQKKACGGYCKSTVSCKGVAPRRWIIAACGGNIGVLEKAAQCVAARADGEAVFTAPAAFADYLRDAAEHAAFEQLVVVGSANDVAWVSAIIPPDLHKCVVAEMTYPLVKEWFREPGLPKLSAVLTPLMQ